MTVAINKTWEELAENSSYPLISSASRTEIPNGIIKALNISYLSNNEYSFYLTSINISENSINMLLSNSDNVPVLALHIEKPVSTSTIYKFTPIPQ